MTGWEMRLLREGSLTLYLRHFLLTSAVLAEELLKAHPWHGFEVTRLSRRQLCHPAGSLLLQQQLKYQGIILISQIDVRQRNIFYQIVQFFRLYLAQQISLIQKYNINIKIISTMKTSLEQLSTFRQPNKEQIYHFITECSLNWPMHSHKESSTTRGTPVLIPEVTSYSWQLVARRQALVRPWLGRVFSPGSMLLGMSLTQQIPSTCGGNRIRMVVILVIILQLLYKIKGHLRGVSPWSIIQCLYANPAGPKGSQVSIVQIMMQIICTAIRQSSQHTLNLVEYRVISTNHSSSNQLLKIHQHIAYLKLACYLHGVFILQKSSVQPSRHASVHLEAGSHLFERCLNVGLRATTYHFGWAFNHTGLKQPGLNLARENTFPPCRCWLIAFKVDPGNISASFRNHLSMSLPRYERGKQPFEW